MKFWFLVLIPLVLWLTINPCCADTQEMETVPCYLGQADDSPNTEHPPCSPFYGCGACKGFFVKEGSSQFFGKTFYHKIDYALGDELSIPLGSKTSRLKPPNTSRL